MSDSEKEGGAVAEIIEAVVEKVELFHDQDSNGYALVIGDGNVMRIGSSEFSNYVSYIAWECVNKALTTYARDAVIATLEAKARYEGDSYNLSIRTAWHENALWYDLGKKAVRIDETGWKIIDEPPILFKRFSHQLPQTEPVSGGVMNDVLRFLNIPLVGEERDEMSILILTYLVSVLIPDVPRPVLVIHGLPGAAKSTFFKVIKSLIDPSQLETMTYPRDSVQLIQILSHHFSIFFDNISELDDWQSDELCKAVTGHAFSKRKLFTDDDDIMYRYKRALGLNGINLVTTRSDLLDRSLIFELQPISGGKRLIEEAFWNEFVEERPKLLGALFSTVSLAMKFKKEGKVVLRKKPRLADYALWAGAASLALGYTVEYYENALAKNIDKQNEEAIDSSPIALVVLDYMERHKVGVEVKMSSKQWFDVLLERAKDLGFEKDKEFPKTQGWLWRKIKPVKANLKNIGIDTEYFSKERPRQIAIKKNAKISSGNTVINSTNQFGIDMTVRTVETPISTEPPKGVITVVEYESGEEPEDVGNDNNYDDKSTEDYDLDSYDEGQYI
ncbi:MAG: hypothetical protein KGI50_00215 [Patescibacteria group bacterium]|nr:hypothetical protein [Patescibacteria group bacterium]MDE2438214.1 hypothetical protein [Patescibacteria group bacterium]